MKLENQVCTVEQSVLLERLGIASDSQFFHVKIGDKFKVMRYKEFDTCNDEIQCHPAFTTAELGVMLPKEVHAKKFDDDVSWGCSVESHLCFSIPENEESKKLFVPYKTEAIAKAQFLIYLLETNLTTAAEVNERLAKG